MSDYYYRFRTWPSLFGLTRGSYFLDIGCGKGRLGEYLKDNYQAKVTGIEIFEAYAEEARNVLNNVICGNVEELNLDNHLNTYDYILFSDSLEHLIDPERTLMKVKLLLKRGGSILLAIPNIRNFRVTIPLLIFDQFEYQEEGLLDRTHLRFFTRTSIVNTLKKCGFEVDKIYEDLPFSSKVGIINIITLGLFKNILTSHFFIRACLKNS
jgi:2-polyprenyl-3-methyl-5-hydroxy-6-metoxy-1,4-benzoquinol methylase